MSEEKFEMQVSLQMSENFMSTIFDSRKDKEIEIEKLMQNQESLFEAIHNSVESVSEVPQSLSIDSGELDFLETKLNEKLENLKERKKWFNFKQAKENVDSENLLLGRPHSDASYLNALSGKLFVSVMKMTKNDLVGRIVNKLLKLEVAEIENLLQNPNKLNQQVLALSASE